MCVYVKHLSCCQALSAEGKVVYAVVVAFDMVACEKTRRTRLALVGPGAGVGED